MVALVTLPATASAAQILEMIERDGACIVSGLLSDDLREDVLAEVDPFIEQTQYGEATFSGSRTRRTGALVARAPSVRDVVMNDHVLQVANQFLLRFADRIQLNLTQTIAIEPGQGSQPLHRDRFGWGNFIPETIEPQFNAIWALSDFSAENGATLVVPGSHRWGWERKATAAEVCQAEMTPGSVLLHTGSVIHAGGENRTNKTRLGLNITYCLGWLRQEENQYLSCPPDIAREFPIALQELLGYTQGNYALGYFSDPDNRYGTEAGILAPETAVGAKPRSEWISTEHGYQDIELADDR